MTDELWQAAILTLCGAIAYLSRYILDRWRKYEERCEADRKILRELQTQMARQEGENSFETRYQSGSEVFVGDE